MLFAPTTCATLWDTSLFREGSTHYLFYLASTRLDRPWDALALATSADGVHFEDHGPIIEKASDAEWLGGGMTWKCGDRYLLNFSECRAGRQAVYFAESSDLVHWRRIPAEVSSSQLDPRWYANGTAFSDQRWDGIWVVEKDGAPGYFGYLTAVSKEGPEGLRGTVASATSEDGLRFQAGPPVVAPGVWGDKLELGAVTRLGQYYYMLVAQAEVPLGLRWTMHHPQAAGGVYVLRADHQNGPFVLDPRQQPLLVSAPEHYTYFARFYDNAGEALVCHHSVSPARDIATVQPKAGTYFAPLKTIIVDDGLLRLGWWPGNNALLGRETRSDLDALDWRGLTAPPIVKDGQVYLEAAAGAIAALPYRYDLERGVIIDASMSVAEGYAGLFGAGLVIEGSSMWSGTLLLADNTGTLSVGRYNGYAYRADDTKTGYTRELSHRSRWRVLVRRQFVELYVDDQLVQCYTLPGRPSGRVAFVVESCKAIFGDVIIREMQM